mgnify:CR=1 FL=1
MPATQSAPKLKPMPKPMPKPTPVPEPFTRSASASLAGQLAGRFADRIQQRLLAPGARLPSVRDCAERHGVSPSTVVGAYDLLQARGLVQARPQRGFFVRDLARDGAPASHPENARQRSPGSALPAPVDATALIRSMFQAQGGLPAPGMGTLPEAWLDAPLLQRALEIAEPLESTVERLGRLVDRLPGGVRGAGGARGPRAPRT